jgi:undecaprenyl phosphate-alpha-L-ara4N flippase subunit ArnE
MRPDVVAFAVAGALLAAFGQVSFKHGAEGHELAAEFVNGWIFLGLLLYLAGTVLWIRALASAPLTVVYPFTALTYLMVNALAVALLGERLSPRGLLGTACVLLGLFLVATSMEVNHAPQ